MKPALFTILALILFFTSCRKHNDDAGGPGPYVFRVDLQSDYENDHVDVYVDSTRTSSDSVQTLLSLGLAKIIPDTVKAGSHKLRVVVNNGSMVDTTFSVSSDLYIGVIYHRATGKFEFDVSRYPFIYL